MAELYYCRERIMTDPTVRLDGTFRYGPKQVCAACLLSGLVAAAITLTSESSAENGPIPAVTVVNRAAKADRLQPAQFSQRSRTPNKSTQISKLRASGPIPVGCELAVSRIIDPDSDILRGCLS